MENTFKQVTTKKYTTHQFVLHMASYVCHVLDEISSGEHSSSVGE